MKKQQGFSLIEIMVVMIIIGVILAGVSVKFFSRADEARVKQATSDFAAIEKALKMYRLDNYSYPTSEQGLEALVTKPSIEPVPRQWSGYLDGVPVDPWGNTYVYLSPGEDGRDFEVYSLGSDGRAGGEAFAKDLYNWQRFKTSEQ